MSAVLLARSFAHPLILSLGIALALASSGGSAKAQGAKVSISGYVVDVSGNPLAGLKVTVSRGYADLGHCDKQQCTTDNKGSYSIEVDPTDAKEKDPITIDFYPDVTGKNKPMPKYTGTTVEALVTHKGSLQINVALPNRAHARAPQLRTEVEIVRRQIIHLVQDKVSSSEIRDLYGPYAEGQIRESLHFRNLDLDNELLALDLLIERDASPLAFSPDAKVLLSARTPPNRNETELDGWSNGANISWSLPIHEPFADFKMLTAERLLAGTMGGSLKLWRVRDDGKPQNLADEKPESLADDLGFLPGSQGAVAIGSDRHGDGTLFASGGSNGAITIGQVIDAHTVRRLATLYSGTGAVRALAFSPNRELLGTVTLDGTVSVWNVDQRSDERRGRRSYGEPITGHLNIGCANSLAFSPDGKHLAIGSGLVGKGSIALIPLEALGDRASNVDLEKKVHVEGTDAGVTAIGFANKGKRVLAAMNATSTFVAWDISDDGAFEGKKTLAEGVIGSFAITPDGNRVGLLEKESGKPILMFIE